MRQLISLTHPVHLLPTHLLPFLALSPSGLGRASLARGHRVEVMLPFYECLDTSAIEDLTSVRSVGSYWKGDFVGVEVSEG